MPVLSQALRAMAGEPGGVGAADGTGRASGADFSRWLLWAAAVGLAVGALLGLITLVI